MGENDDRSSVMPDRGRRGRMGVRVGEGGGDVVVRVRGGIHPRPAFHGWRRNGRGR